MAAQNPKISKSKRTFFWISLSILVLVIVISIASGGSDNSKSDKPVVTRKERVDALFSDWDGDQDAVKDWIKSQLNDPDSYKNIATKFKDEGDSILVRTEFTAKNGFGGRLRYLCYAYIDSAGHFMHGNIVQK